MKKIFLILIATMILIASISKDTYAYSNSTRFQEYLDSDDDITYLLVRLNDEGHMENYSEVTNFIETFGVKTSENDYHVFTIFNVGFYNINHQPGSELSEDSWKYRIEYHPSRKNISLKSSVSHPYNNIIWSADDGKLTNEFGYTIHELINTDGKENLNTTLYYSSLFGISVGPIEQFPLELKKTTANYFSAKHITSLDNKVVRKTIDFFEFVSRLDEISYWEVKFLDSNTWYIYDSYTDQGLNNYRLRFVDPNSNSSKLIYFSETGFMSSEMDSQASIVYYKLEVPVTEATLTFNSNGGTEIDPQVISIGDIPTRPDDPTKEGYEFTGWKVGNAFFDFDAPIESDTTVYATWKKIEYTITFEAYGSNPIEKVVINAPDSISEPISPERFGYFFTGWYLNDELFDFDTVISENVTLVAKYTRLNDDFDVIADFEDTNIPNEYNTYTFDSNGVEFTLSGGRNQDIYYINNKGIILQKLGSFLNINMEGNLDTIYFQYRKAYNGSTAREWKVTIWKSGTLLHTYYLEPFGASNNIEDDVYEFRAEGLNLSGSYAIKIEAVGGTINNQHIVLDNFAFITDIEYTIEYQTEGGTIYEDAVMTQAVRLKDLPVPTRENKRFVGWYYDRKRLEQHKVLPDDIIRKDVTLWAKWADAYYRDDNLGITITGNVDMYLLINNFISNQSYYESKPYFLGDYVLMQFKENYEALLEAEGFITGDSFKVYFDDFNTIRYKVGTDNRTREFEYLEFKYDANYYTKVRINIDNTTDSLSNIHALRKMEAILLSDDVRLIEIASVAPYSVHEWHYTYSNGTIKKENLNDNLDYFIDADLTIPFDFDDVAPNKIYSQTKINPDNPTYFSVTYHYEKGTNLYGNKMEKEYTAEVKQGDLIIPYMGVYQNGYKLVGWKEKAKEAYDFSIPINRNLEFYPIFEKDDEIVINFETNGGSSLQDYVYGQIYKYEDLPISVKSKSVFLGWYLEPTLETEASGLIRRYDHTLYAKWLSNASTVHFETNGGYELSSIIVTNGTVLNISIPPKRPGYLFDGWYLEPTFETEYVNQMIESNTTLYASWKVNPDEKPVDPVNPDETPVDSETETTLFWIAGGVLLLIGVAINAAISGKRRRRR